MFAEGLLGRIRDGNLFPVAKTKVFGIDPIGLTAAPV